jgi:DNA repair exonuclease SbcCD ATPase subunit
MNEHRTGGSANNDHLREAELRKLESEATRNEAERLKLESENLEIRRRLSQRWWDIRFSTLIQVAIAGIVGGALLWGFALDHFLKISDMIKKEQLGIEKEIQDIAKENKEIKEQRLKYIDDVQILKDKTESMAKDNAALARQVKAAEARESARLERAKEKLKELEQQQPPSKAKEEQLAIEKTEAKKQITALEEKVSLLESESKNIETRSKTIKKDFDLLSKYTVLVFYRRQQQFKLKNIESALLSIGYQASRIPTDFSELSKTHPRGTTYITYTERGKEIINDIKTELKSLNIEGSLVIPLKAIKLRRGDIQILLF